jgi:hypothetical protein
MPANIPSTVSLSVTNISGGLSWTYNGTTSTDFSVNTSGFFSYGKNFSSGIGASQSNIYIANTITIPTESNIQINLLTPSDDAFGNSFYFTKVRVIYIEVAENSADIIIGGGQNNSGLNAFSTFLGDSTDKIRVSAGSLFELTNLSLAGYSVGGSTSVLRFSNADTIKSAVIRYFIAGS